MRIIQKINQIVDLLFGMEIIKTRPKEAVKFAKKYFKGREVIAIEIGILDGKNSKGILRNLDVKRIYLIDPYEKYTGYEKDADHLNLKLAEKISKKRLEKYHQKIVWIKELSEKGIKKIKEMVDFIYVDGNHEYDYVMKDLILGWKILKKEGVLSGHDIQYSGVSRAVLDFAKKKNLDVNFGERRDWWFIKN